MKISKLLVSSVLVSASILGAGLFKSAFAQTGDTSSTAPKTVLVVCGPHGAARVVDANKIPPGCRVSTVNSPPAGSN